VRFEKYADEVSDAIDRLEEVWQDVTSEANTPTGHRNRVKRVSIAMGNVLAALQKLDDFWQQSKPSQKPENAAKRMSWASVPELIAAGDFRQRMIDRLNAMFSQKALADRYGVSKRTVEGWYQGRTGKDMINHFVDRS
jgi:aminoglycoside phosphotransferase (APT) family kinase protein